MTEGSLTDIGEAADKVCEGRADWTEECRGGRACSVASVTSDSLEHRVTFLCFYFPIMFIIMFIVI